MRVFFLKYYEKGSTLMGADQISAGLRDRGVDSHAIHPGQLAGVRDSIVVCIKTSRLDHLLRLRRQGNRTVLDVQDTVVFKRRIKNRLLFDALIWKSRRQLVDFGGRGGRRSFDRVIYHQWDPRYRPHEAPPDELRIAYLGLRRSFPLWGRVPGVECADADYFRRALAFNCHFSARPPGREFLYKPGTKVSTAAACDAVVLTTRDESALEMLGPDYPYYTTGGELPDLVAAVERARATFGGPLWQAALARLREVRERTRMERILDDYLELFSLLDARAWGSARP